MKQGTFKKLLLIATFALFTTISASLNYCFGNTNTSSSTQPHNLEDFCPMCGRPTDDLQPDYSDWDQFGYVFYTCPCGFWFVFYTYN